MSRAREIGRRAALGAIGAGAAGVALWPRTPRSRVDVPRGRVVIDYWEKWTGEEGAAIQRVVDLFNASQDRIWVRRVPVSDIKTKAMIAIAGGDPPDVVGLFSFSVAQMAESGAAMSMDELGAGSEEIDAESYKPAVRRLLSYEGKQWAGVNTCYTLALYYNKALFREVGLDPERPPRTVAELDEAAERLTVRGTGGVGILRAGFLQNVPLWWPYFWPVVFGGELYDAGADRAVFADEACVRAYSWVQSYPERLGRGATAQFATAHARAFHQADDPFFTGRVGMIVQGPWIATFMRRQNPGLEYGAAPVPVAAGLYDEGAPLGLVEADVLMIPRGCRHPAEAYEFVRFTQTREAQELLATLHGKSSPMREDSPGFAAGHVNRSVGVHDAITGSERVSILPQTRVWQQYSDLTISAFQSVWDGADVRATLRGVEARAQGLMDQAARLRALRGSGGAA